MRDLVQRLRDAAGFALMDAARATVLEAADEIERLRLELFMKPVPNILVMADAMLRERQRLQNDAPGYTAGISAASESKNHDATLTDAEREALEQLIDAANGEATAEPWAAATLRGLLERLG